METLPVTLIVKAPNQQIEDQTIKCELSWTINKLKQHLSEVYPSKPAKHEQKLIYSGQLLSDSVMLKDILRQYDGQEIHTVHLVCTSKHSKAAPPRPKPSPPPTTMTPQPSEPSVGGGSGGGSATAAQSTTNTDHNNSASSSNSSFPINSNTWGHNNVAAVDPNQYAMQLAWMQQTYLQYMAQYMQLAAHSYGTTGANGLPTQSIDSSGQVLPNNNQTDQPPQPAGLGLQQQQQQQPAVVPPPLIQQQQQRDPDNPERDWLDVFYLLSRVMVLFSVVYFYSSPIRFLFVLFLGFVLYLYQIGFFRNINNNNNNNNTTVPPVDPVEPQEQEQAPSRLMVVWTFFATFFASLIPEIPNAV